MVEICRWLKALLSSVVTVLMSMPSRLAASRSILRLICWAPSPSLASMLVSSGSSISARLTCGTQVRRAPRSLASKV